MFNFKDSLNSVKSYIRFRIDKLEKRAAAVSRVKSASIRSKATTSSTDISDIVNMNRIEYFKLNRCALQSGRILWLCDEHSVEENVQVLSESHTVSSVQYQTNEFDMILLDELKKINVEEMSS